MGWDLTNLGVQSSTLLDSVHTDSHLGSSTSSPIMVYIKMRVQQLGPSDVYMCTHDVIAVVTEELVYIYSSPMYGQKFMTVW